MNDRLKSYKDIKKDVYFSFKNSETVCFHNLEVKQVGNPLSRKPFQYSSNGVCVSLFGDELFAGAIDVGYADVSIMGDRNRVCLPGQNNLSYIGNNSDIGISGKNAIINGENNAVCAVNGGTILVQGRDNYIKGESDDIEMPLIILAKGHNDVIQETSGKAIICDVGANAMAKAEKGSWITLAEYGKVAGKLVGWPICVKTEYVDGKRIKAGVWYMLKNGEFKELKDE